MLIYLVHQTDHEEVGAVLVTTLREDGHEVRSLPIGEYGSAPKSGDRDLTVFLVGEEASVADSPIIEALGRAKSDGRRLLAVSLTPDAVKSLPRDLTEAELLVPLGDPVVETAFYIHQRFGRRDLKHLARRSLLLMGAVALLLVAVWLGFRIAGPGRVSLQSDRILPEFEILPPVAFAEWGGEAVFQLVNNNGLANVDYRCKVIDTRQSPNIASIDFDDKCAEIRIRAKMGPFVNRAGKVTKIGQFNPGEDNLEVHVFDEVGTLIWKSTLPFGAMNGIQFQVNGLETFRRTSSGRVINFQAEFAREEEVEITYAGKSLGPGFDCTVVEKAGDRSPVVWEIDRGETPCQLRMKPVLSDFYQSKGYTFDRKALTTLSIELRHEETGMDHIINIHIYVKPNR